MGKSFKKCLIVCFVSMVFLFFFHYFISDKIEFVRYENGYLRIQDYAYYIIMAKDFWFKGFGNIYELSFQQHSLASYIGSHFNYAMPLGITPIALLVWFPFSYVARFSMALSYTLWITFSCCVLFTALWRIGGYVFQRTKPQLLPIALSFITIFSITMFRSLYLGQTSVLATGLLAHLIFIVYEPTKKSKSNINSLIPLLIFTLGIKPTYFALSLGLLIIYGMWRQAIYSSGIAILALVGLTPFLTTEWILSYFHQFSIFSRNIIPDAYVSAFVPHTMNIFRSTFRNLIGDNTAGLISTIVTCGVYMSVIGFSIFAKIKGQSTEQLSILKLKIRKGQLFILIVASYLLFTPYAGGYEDILFLSVFITVLLVGNSPNLTNYKSIILICILFFILLHNALPPNKPLWFFWILKTVLLVYMLNFCRVRKERKGCTD